MQRFFKLDKLGRYTLSFSAFGLGAFEHKNIFLYSSLPDWDWLGVSHSDQDKKWYYQVHNDLSNF